MLGRGCRSGTVTSEVESVPSSYEVETVVSVPEGLQDSEPMSRQR